MFVDRYSKTVVFRARSNIYDETFLQKYVTAFSR